MHVMMVDTLLQVVVNTLRATRGEYPTHLSLGSNTSEFSWPRRIKASTSFVAQLRVETQNKMGSIVHRGQSGEDDLRSHMSLSTISHGKNQSWMKLDGWRQMIHGTNITLKFKSFVKHGISNGL